MNGIYGMESERMSVIVGRTYSAYRYFCDNPGLRSLGSLHPGLSQVGLSALWVFLGVFLGAGVGWWEVIGLRCRLWHPIRGAPG